MALDSHLSKRTFLVRNRLTLADIVVSTSLLPGFVGLFDPGFRKALKNTNRWFMTCVNQPHFISVLGQVTLCEKKPVAPAPEKKEEQQPKEQPKKEKPKKEQPKKEVEEDVEEDVAPVVRKKPFLNLPPSPFNMNEFKVYLCPPHFPSFLFSLLFLLLLLVSSCLLLVSFLSPSCLLSLHFSSLTELLS
jgi:elongation factor 1-gamma